MTYAYQGKAMVKRIYENQVKLLLDVISYIDWDKCFALKGGTAINLFYEDMPRVSVDLDLVFLPVKSREDSFSEMKRELDNLNNKLTRIGFKVKSICKSRENPIGKFKISNPVATIKLEPNTVLRGAVLPTELKSLCPKAQNAFSKNVSVRCLAYKELYAGKLHALVDRQHPRDIFDMIQFNKKGHSIKSIMDIFIAYVLQGNRPFSELLDPNSIDIKGLYQHSFAGMTEGEIEFKELLKYRERVFNEIKSNLTHNHRKIILSFMEKKPDFDPLPFKNLSSLPAIKWKLENIHNMSEKKRILELSKLEKIFRG
jgi:predicted nucleotidyltransferase component of viral defense system